MLLPLQDAFEAPRFFQTILKAFRTHFVLASAALLLFAPLVRAQYRTSIQGVVTDTQGGVIPGATLTLTNTATNEKQVRTSSEVGVFNFNALPADRFTLVVTKDGFQTKTLNNVQLIPEQANALNIQMEVGGVTQTVTVDASESPLINTENANISRAISDNEVQHLPVYQRDPTSLVRLAPGVLADGAQQAGSAGGFQAPGTQTGASSGGGGNVGATSSIFATENGPSASANGGQFDTNSFSVDGISTESAVWGGATIVTPSEDSIGNIQILTNAYDAEYGRFSGALTQITSKSGTNRFHGSFFFQIVRPGLNAYQRWNGPNSVNAGTPASRGLLRNENRYNQLGGSINGPIWKNKVFASFAYEGQSLNTPLTSVQWFPTTAFAGLAPANSISSVYLSFPGATVAGTPISGVTCSSAGLVEGANCVTIPGQGLNIGSPLTTGLGKQDLTYVSNTEPGVGSGLSTTPDITQYTISNPTSSNFKQYYGRADANLSDRDRLAFAIYWVPVTLTRYDGGLSYQLFNHDQISNAFSLIWNHTFSPTFLNEARANAAGWRWNELTSNPQAPFGLPQAQLFTANTTSGPQQIGSISLGSLGVPAPSHLNQWTYGYKDVATKIQNSHTMKFGFDFTRLYYLNDPIGAPNYTFYNIWSFLNDAPMAENGPFQAKTGFPGGYRNDNRMNIWGIFFQDDWKVRPNLTINAGLRYSYFGPLTDKNNNMGVLTFGAGANYLTGITIRPGINGWSAQNFNFGPQLGFNWSPAHSNGRIVIRGGYGLNYNQQQIATANIYNGNPPGTSSVPGSSTSPTNINPNIIYAISTDPHNINGFPANPNAKTDFNQAGLPKAGGANIGALPGHMPTAYVHHYSLETQTDLGHQWVVTVGYMGSSGKHLVYNYDSNALGTIMGDSLNPLVNSINTFGSRGSSSNNLLLARINHQFARTFSVDAQYTWAHSFDTNSGPYFRSPYLFNTSYSRGTSDFDVRNYFKFFAIWQPLIFRGGHNWAEKVVGGWTISGILTYHSGYGWTPVYTAPHQIYCNACNYGFQSLRPHYLGGAGRSTSNNAFKTGSNFPNPGTNPFPSNYPQFKNNYFSVPNYADATADQPGQVASAFIPAPGLGRNTFPGPQYRGIDLNLAKAFTLPRMPLLGENARIEVKANMLNAFNLLNIDPSSISNNISSANLGQASRGLGARTIDFQARFSF